MLERTKFLILSSLLLFAGIFFVYLLGVSKSVYGGDSGDVILAAYFGGVAHPPGYPLNSLIGFLFTHLPISGSVAYRANIMMAIFSAGTVTFLFLSLRNLTRNYFVALAAPLTLAFTPLFWLYAHVAEVFQLNVLLVSASFYFLTLWIEAVSYKKRRLQNADKWLFLSIFFLGIAVFHHQTSVLLLPAYILLICKTDKSRLRISKKGFFLALAFILGVVPYIAIPFLALRQTPVNWDNASNLRNLLQLMARADYGSFVASSSFVSASYKERILQIVSYFAFVKNDFTIVGTFLILLGGIHSFLHNRKLFWFLFWAIFFTGPFFLFYSSFSLSSDFLFGIWERFILLSYFFLTVYLAWGLLFLYQKFPIIKKIHIKKEPGLLVLGFSFFLIPLYMIRANWVKTDMSKFELGDRLGHDVLASSAPGSLIFLFDDTTAFNTQYVYYTGKEFRDRKLVLGGIMRHLFYRDQLVRQYPELVFPDGFLENKEAEGSVYLVALAQANLGKVPIYSVDFSPDIKGYRWISVGLLKKLVVESSSKDKDYVKKLNEEAFLRIYMKGSYKTSKYSNFIEQSIKRFYVFSFNEVGDQMLEVKNFGDAKNFYSKALEISSDDPRASFGFGRSSLELGDCQGAKYFLLKSYKLNNKSTRVLTVLADEARRCERNEDLAKQYEGEAERILRSQMEKL